MVVSRYWLIATGAKIPRLSTTSSSSRGYTPRLELKSAIEDAQLGCEVLMVGDCVEVRNFFDAINEGAHVVRTALS